MPIKYMRGGGYNLNILGYVNLYNKEEKCSNVKINLLGAISER